MGVVAINHVEFGSLLFWVTKKFRNFSEKEKFIGKYTKVVPQGSKDQGSRYVSRTMNHRGKLKCGLVNGRWRSLWSKQVPRMNLTRMHNADLEVFVSYKCLQFQYLTDSFVRRIKFTSSRNSHTVLFDLYDKSYTMDLEDFNTACKLPNGAMLVNHANLNIKTFLLVSLWGNLEKSHKLP